MPDQPHLPQGGLIRTIHYPRGNPDHRSTPVAPPVSTPDPLSVPINTEPIGPQLPTADGLDALQKLVLDEIETCAQEQSATLAANPSPAPDAAAQVADISGNSY